MYGIIPARGGSKRIPNKNSKDFCGKPLVMWTIEEALKAFRLFRIILSSDDQYILNIGSMYDIDIHHRFAEISQDDSTAYDVLFNIINTYDLKVQDVIIYLQPTSPLRTYDDITEAYQQYRNKGIAHSLISAVEEPLVRYGHSLNRNNIMTFLHDNNNISLRSKTYIPNGAIYIATVKDLLKYKTFFTNKTLVYVMPKTSSVDINDIDDFEYAEYLMRKRRLEPIIE